MSLSELSNQEIEITLNGRKLKIKRLSINELFAPAEKRVKEDYIAGVQEIAKSLTGKDKQEFMMSALKDIPKGAELDKQAMEYMSTPLGVSGVLMLGLNKCQEISENEVAELMLGASEAELGFLRDYLSGDTEDKKKLRLMEEAKVVQVPS